METASISLAQTLDDELSPEIRSMIGVLLLYWRMDVAFAAKEHDLDLSRQEKHILVQLGEPLRMGVLARRMMQTPSSITASADALQDKGLIRRRQDPADRRAWLLELTEPGVETRDILFDGAQQVFREITGLNASETKQFADLMQRIRAHIMETGLPEGFEL